MQPLTVVVGEKLIEVVASIQDVAILLEVNFLAFERLHEALRSGIIVRVSAAAHADHEAFLFQAADVVVATVLHPTIGVVYGTGQDGAL